MKHLHWTNISSMFVTALHRRETQTLDSVFIVIIIFCNKPKTERGPWQKASRDRRCLRARPQE